MKGGPLDLCRNFKNCVDFPGVLWYSIEHENQRAPRRPSALRDHRSHRSHTVRRTGQDLRNAQAARRRGGRHVLQPPVLGGRQKPHHTHTTREARTVQRRRQRRRAAQEACLGAVRGRCAGHPLVRPPSKKSSQRSRSRARPRRARWRSGRRTASPQTGSAAPASWSTG